MPTTYLVSRHPAAIEWISQQINIDKVIEHLDTSQVELGDIVVGTLPVHLAEEVCRRGGEYIHLQLTIPKELRGVELNTQYFSSCSPRLTKFLITRF